MRNSLAVTCAFAMGLLMTGCGTVRINQLVSDPVRYQNRNVNVEGQVTGGVGALVGGGYQVDDGTGKILVVTNRGNVPLKGSHVRVSGQFQSGITIMNRSFGNVLREDGRKVLR